MSVDSVYHTFKDTKIRCMTLSASVNVHNADTAYKYCVSMYGPSDIQPSGAANYFADLIPSNEHTKTYTCELKHAISETSTVLPCAFHVDLFKTGPDPEMHLDVTLQVGHGELSLVELRDGGKCKVSIKSIEKVEVATLTIQAGALNTETNAVFRAMISNTPSDIKGTVQTMARNCTNAFDVLTKMGFTGVAADRFDCYNTYHGKYPVVAFPYISRLVRVDKQDSERWLLHLMKLAGCMYGRRINEFASLSDDVKGDWLSEMCTIYFRGQAYCHDTAVVNSCGKEAETDTWTQMNSFPADAKRGYDCEDGALWILELLYVLRKGEFSSEYLHQMQQFYSAYTPFFTLGTLHSRDKDGAVVYVDHAYVCLLDNRFAPNSIVGGEKSIDIKYAAPIICESTAYTKGTWSSNRIRVKGGVEKMMDAYAAGQSVFMSPRLAYADAKWKRICKQRAEMEIVTSEKVYGKVYSIVSPDMPDGSVVHYTVVDNERKKASIDVNLFYTYRSVKLHPVYTAKTPEEFSQLNAAIREMPRSKLPKCPPASKCVYPVVQNHATRFVMRGLDYIPAVSEAFDDQYDKISVTTTNNVYISENVYVTFIDVLRKS